MKTVRRLASIVVLCLLVAIPLAHAGHKSNYMFSVDENSAQGQLGNVRNSSDSVGYLGCYISANDTGSVGICSAQHPNGEYASCQSSSSHILRAISSLNGDSHISFKVKSNGYSCDYVIVRNESSLAIKAP